MTIRRADRRSDPGIGSRPLLTWLLALLLSGCGSSPLTPAGTPPAAGADSQTQSPTRADADTAKALPTPAPAAKPDTDAATLALLQQSQRAETAGSINEAIAYTERAIRIAPRQADLWIRLAKLELANTQPESAIQYANKALSLAATRIDWQRDAWLVIADARASLGDTAEAARIRERWQTYRG